MKKIFILLFLAIIGISSATSASALGLKDAFTKNSGIDKLAGKANYDTTSSYVGPEFYIGLALNTVFALIGIILIGLIIYSGIIWMTARGDEGKVTKAKDTLTEAILGLLFIIGGYALSIFLLNVFTK
jgi:hypothetical protein